MRCDQSMKCRDMFWGKAFNCFMTQRQDFHVFDLLIEQTISARLHHDDLTDLSLF